MKTSYEICSQECSTQFYPLDGGMNTCQTLRGFLCLSNVDLCEFLQTFKCRI